MRKCLPDESAAAEKAGGNQKIENVEMWKYGNVEMLLSADLLMLLGAGEILNRLQKYGNQKTKSDHT